MVTIRCTVFNHERYLRECLDGFVIQKTNFRFEAIVHDDAMALIACLLFDYLLIDQIQYSYHIVRALGIEKCVINWECIIILVAILIIVNLLYMGFVKFYKRFTLENYMALLTDKSMNVYQS